MNTDENKKKIIMLFIVLGLILSVIFGVTFSYLAPSINNVESNSTVVFNAGTIAINYENGQNQINASEVLPGWTSIKEFSLTAINNTTISTAGAMNYAIKLIVEKNTFNDGAITYSIEGENVDNNGTIAYVLPNSLKKGASEVILGYGLFDTSSDISKGVTHRYTLTMAFPNKTYESQNEDSGKTLSAHIIIANEGESTFSNLTIADDNNNLNKTIFLKNGAEYELPIIASKAGAYFSGWNVESGNATINGNKITINGDASIKANYSSNIKTEFAYTGNSEKFVAPAAGIYTLETWGAQGGYASDETKYCGGYGGYSVGKVFLYKGDILYVTVGSKGESSTSKAAATVSGGYNGGGIGVGSTFLYVSGGGGATHIATEYGLLTSFEEKIDKLIMVAAGGGGSALQAASVYGKGGSGGGFHGVKSNNVGINYTSSGATQEDTGTGHYKGTFGQGGCDNLTNASYCSGGGGGYYGGDAAQNAAGAAGGSSYIGNYLLTNKAMYCYECTESTEYVDIKTVSTSCHNELPTENCAKEGNGFARITLPEDYDETVEYSTVTVVSENLNKVITFETLKDKETNISINDLIDFNNEFKEFKLVKGSATIDGYKVTPTSDKVVLKVVYHGQVNVFSYIEPTAEDSTPYHSFVASKSGVYKLETWGAQGGGVRGGYGAYSIGSISLNKGDTLYIYVGGQGKNALDGTKKDSVITVTGGYNGGGVGKALTSNTYTNAGSGGGATHIATASGLLSSLSSNPSNILIVSGAGGGTAGLNDNYMVYSVGGSAGGILGNSGILGTNTKSSGAYTLPTGGSQTVGGTKSTGTWASGSNGSFGVGGSSGTRCYGGGGSGYYGGGGGGSSYYISLSGAGGSSYIGNPLLTNKAMYCYECTESSDESTKTISTTCHSEKPTMYCAKEGNGFARITYLDY